KNHADAWEECKPRTLPRYRRSNICASGLKQTCAELPIRRRRLGSRQTMAKQGQGGLEDITGALARAGVKGPPPVARWTPPVCGDLGMRIAADGTWFYMKTPIGRQALVKLFGSILKREVEKYVLVTPVEKCGIKVDDAPFLAVELDAQDSADGRVLSFRTNVDDWVQCGPRHALRFDPEPGT